MKSLTLQNIDKYVNKINTLRNKLIQLVEQEVKKVNYIEIPSDLIEYEVGNTIAYYGGNHPEYASNCFAEIKSLEWKNNDVLISVEDGEQYLSDCNITDVLTIAYIIAFINEEYVSVDEE